MTPTKEQLAERVVYLQEKLARLKSKLAATPDADADRKALLSNKITVVKEKIAKAQAEADAAPATK